MANHNKTISMDDVLRQQAELEEEAAEAIPYTFSSCTFGNATMEEAKQPIYSCLTCRPQPLRPEDRAGICAGCSVSCHGDCELVELFSRRDFLCDCGTTRIKGKKCALTLRLDDTPARENRYDANYDGIFCACQTRYNPETETDEMIQCLVCEDWYHTSKCLGLPAKEDGTPFELEDFDTFICEKCALGEANAALGRYVGTSGFSVLRSDGRMSSETTLPVPSTSTKKAEEDVSEAQESSASLSSSQAVSASESGPSRKRDAEAHPSETGNGQAEDDNHDGPSSAKKQKVEGDNSSDQADSCRAPQGANENLRNADSKRKDIYLAEGWRDQLCRCTKCLLLYSDMPYLLEEEEIYEPPEDADAHKSLFDLGTAALLQMPREQAVQGLTAYTNMRDKLRAYLEPFAREGKVVEERDIQSFFEAERQRIAELARGA